LYLIIINSYFKEGANMIRKEFILFLEGSGLTPKASSARASWCSRVEKTYNVDLDIIVTDKDKTLDLIERIGSEVDFTKRQRQNFPNAIRYYYRYINGDILGTLKGNGR
jgi:hypothetical protein